MKVIAVAVLFIIFYQNVYALGQGREGGDAVWCEAYGNKFPVDGYYSLDYLAFGSIYQLEYSGPPMDHLERIYNRLSEIPILIVGWRRSGSQALARFREFIDDLKVKEGGGASNWIPTDDTEPLVDVKDEALSFLWPPNCERKTRQAVTKYRDYFVYNVTIENQQKDLQGDLQISMRNVHEMLRMVISDSQSIQDANIFFHSKKFFAKSYDTLTIENLINWGLVEKTDGYVLSVGTSFLSSPSVANKVLDGLIGKFRLLHSKKERLKVHMLTTDTCRFDKVKGIEREREQTLLKFNLLLRFFREAASISHRNFYKEIAEGSLQQKIAGLIVEKGLEEKIRSELRTLEEQMFALAISTARPDDFALETELARHKETCLDRF